MYSQQGGDVVLITEAFLLLVPAAVGGVAVVSKNVNDGVVIGHDLCMLAYETKPLPMLAPQVWCDAFQPKARMLNIPAGKKLVRLQILEVC